jgi:hypothetical protein
MLQRLAFHAQKTIPAISVQDLNPRPCADNAHASVCEDLNPRPCADNAHASCS